MIKIELFDDNSLVLSDNKTQNLIFYSLDGVNQKHIFDDNEAVSGRDRFIYSVLDILPKGSYKSKLQAKGRYNTGRYTHDLPWQQGYAVRIGRWKFYNYASQIGIKPCIASGFKNEKLFNDLKNAYPTTWKYNFYMKLTKNTSDTSVKKNIQQERARGKELGGAVTVLPYAKRLLGKFNYTMIFSLLSHSMSYHCLSLNLMSF